jgi:acid phosphatase type 7
VVTCDGVYTFVLATGSSDAAEFYAREGASPPRLVLTVDPSRPPVSSSTPLPGDTATPAATGTPAATPGAGGEAILLAAGDISTCANGNDEATARLLDSLAGTVATLGDNAYQDGTAAEFANCYGPTWGRHQARTKPAPGNHDYHTAGASGYYGYFGAAAGDPSAGYYAYDLGSWHVVVLNSNVAMGTGSAQEQWLRADLAAHPTACTLAYMHHPRFSSGAHGSSTATQPLWQALYDAGADLVLVGHDHDYERFAPQDPSGKADPQRGIREIVVGTGGKDLRGFGTVQPNSEVRNSATNGVLKLTLRDGGYAWEFVPVAGQGFTDSGTGSCH